MKRILYPFYILLFFLLMAFAIPQEQEFVHPDSDCDNCHSMILPAASYQMAQGQWLEQDGGRYWYLHTDAEFDTLDCQSCHPEMGPTIWACPGEGQDCRVIVDENGNLYFECERNDPEL